MATQSEENNPKIIADDKNKANFKITKENTILGKGAFGTVYLGTKTNADGKKEKVALKEIPKQLNDEESQKALQNEIDICEKLDNTNIVKMIKIEKNIDDKIYLHDIKPENILIQLFPEDEMTPEIEKKINDIKEATSKKHKQKNNQVKNNNNQITNQNNGVNQNNQNNNNFYQNNTYYQNNINYYQANNNNYYQNNNNNYYLNNNNNNNNAINNNTYYIPHSKSNNNHNHNQTYYNQVYTPIPNQFNNNNLYNNFYRNNNFNENNYQPNNNLNPYFNNFQNNNLNNPYINNLNLMNSKSNPQINKIPNNFNNIYYNNNNQNNQDNNNIEKPIDKSEILKILKNAQFKLSDFGLSKIKSEKNKKDGKGDDQGNRCGSPLYMSPELFLLETTMGTIENQKVDIWALGILAFEMFFGRRPFEAYSIEQLSKMYRKREYYLNLNGENKKISKEFVEFLNLCLQELPKERADVYCLQHTDFYNLDYNTLEILNENELSSSLGSPDRDEQNNILLRIDEKYYEASTEENKQ